MTKDVEDALRESIKRHEGFRDRPYLCPAGHWTVGWGHNLEAHHPNEWRQMIEQTFSDEECEQFLADDMARATDSAKQSCLALGVGWDKLPDWTQAGLIEMCFQMGSVRWRGLMKALGAGDLELAARQALDSKWFREDSPNRALDVAHWIANRTIRFERGPDSPGPSAHATFNVVA